MGYLRGVRMGRKEGMSVIGLSQVIEDFVRSPYGAAIRSRALGHEEREQIEGLGRQVDVPVMADELPALQIEDAVAERHAHWRSGGKPGEYRPGSKDSSMVATDIQ